MTIVCYSNTKLLITLFTIYIVKIPLWCRWGAMVMKLKVSSYWFSCVHMYIFDMSLIVFVRAKIDLLYAS